MTLILINKVMAKIIAIIIRANFHLKLILPTDKTQNKVFSQAETLKVAYLNLQIRKSRNQICSPASCPIPNSYWLVPKYIYLFIYQNLNITAYNKPSTRGPIAVAPASLKHKNWTLFIINQFRIN